MKAYCCHSHTKNWWNIKFDCSVSALLFTMYHMIIYRLNYRLFCVCHIISFNRLVTFTLTLAVLLEYISENVTMCLAIFMHRFTNYDSYQKEATLGISHFNKKRIINLLKWDSRKDFDLLFHIASASASPSYYDVYLNIYVFICIVSSTAGKLRL